MESEGSGEQSGMTGLLGIDLRLDRVARSPAGQGFMKESMAQLWVQSDATYFLP